ncbi:MAG: alanine--tRNA ligase, partial [Miltoncostaeaceae bacterium]
MTTAEIREGFLRYFEREGHLRIPSASLVPFEDDPSVLLTIAGMQPLKSYFLGQAQPPAHRMTSSQKCFRTLDIDQVGRTARHLTFFEMLGNFSIGDYFKDDAIRFGFELSTEVLGFDPEQIWITVFEGMDGVPADDEALEKWVEMGIPRERIQRLGEADNFWKAGPTGPCGPNTELYLDRGPDFGPEGGPVTGTDRFLEFWNLVFMQYDRAEDGTLTTLPAKNIDTGAGLERLAAILQDKQTVFETDGFRPLVAWAEQVSGRAYGTDPRVDRAMRVLADHGRAMTFLAADGVRPGNEGRDYVLRRIIRRAVSEGAYLGLEPSRITGLVDVVADGYGDAYPELVAERAEVTDTVGAEAEQFARTLEQGTRLLEEVLDRSRTAGVISGDDAFRLHDTYGFPLDLTRDAAEEHGLAVDEEGFGRLMGDQRERARAAARKGKGVDRQAAEALAARSAVTAFVGYDRLEVVTTVTAIQDLGDGEALAKLADSPFYAEGGGQVSDHGWITGNAGTAEVLDVLRLGDDQVLRIAVDGDLPEGSEVTARVDAAARHATQANHTGTHVLNWALRGVLGDGVRQAGSYVGPDKLRFDFTHRGRIEPDELAEIERRVNDRVADDSPVVATVMPRGEADSLGAIGLFEEKYGEVVRVVQAGDFSKELCGGCHVSRTGEIGPMVIVSEGSTGAATRRIEAVTGLAAVDHLRAREAALSAELAQRDERIRALEADLKRAR